MPRENDVSDYNESINDCKRNLSGAVNIYYRAINWALSWARQARANVSLEEIDGFFINHEEMCLLRLDLKGILTRISERSFNNAMSMPPPLDYWAQAITRYAFRVKADELEWAVPGFDHPEIWRIEKLQFRQNPRFLPMSNILEAFRGYGLPLGIAPKDLIFKYDGIAIEEATTLVNNIMAACTETALVMIEMRRWRNQVFEIISQACENSNQETMKKHTALKDVDSECDGRNSAKGIENPSEPALFPEDDIMEQLEGQMVSRQDLARLLNRTPRTLKNWDVKGEAPGGLEWHAADEVTANGALYEVAKNWETLLELTAKERDLQKDRQLATELFEHNGLTTFE